MSLQRKHALITGSSRGIGRGITLKLAAQGVKVAINYRQNADAANDTLAQVRTCGSDGFCIQADVSHADDIGRMFAHIQTEFGGLDIFVNNALGELFTYYQTPMALTLEQWHLALASQAQAFLLCAQEAVRLMPDASRIVAITYAPGGRTGSWQPYVAQGTAKAATDSLVRYFAVALAPRGITVNSISPGGVFGPPNVVEGGSFVRCRKRFKTPFKPGTRVAGHQWDGSQPRQTSGMPLCFCAWTRPALLRGKRCTWMVGHP